MTIQEAIKSGKPFKRPAHDEWFTEKTFKEHYRNITFTLSSMLADDWEIKTEPMVIWVNVYPDGISTGYQSEERAKLCRMDDAVTKKFIEVIE